MPTLRRLQQAAKLLGPARHKPGRICTGSDIESAWFARNSNICIHLRLAVLYVVTRSETVLACGATAPEGSSRPLIDISIHDRVAVPREEAAAVSRTQPINDVDEMRGASFG